MSSWAWCQQLLEHLICAPRDSRGRGLSNDSWNYTLVEATESFFLEDHFSSRWDIGVLHLPRGLFHSLPYLRNLPVAWDKTTCNYFINLPLRVERIIRSHFIVASIFEKCLRLQPCLYVIQWDGSHSSRWASHQGTHEICKQTVTSLRSVQNLQTLIYTHNHSSLWDVHHHCNRETSVKWTNSFASNGESQQVMEALKSLWCQLLSLFQDITRRNNKVMGNRSHSSSHSIDVWVYALAFIVLFRQKVLLRMLIHWEICSMGRDATRSHNGGSLPEFGKTFGLIEILSGLPWWFLAFEDLHVGLYGVKWKETDMFGHSSNGASYTMDVVGDRFITFFPLEVIEIFLLFLIHG